MRRLRNIANLRGCERGATAVEYGFIIALIVLAIIGVLTSVAEKTTGKWNYVSNQVTKN